MTRISKHVIVLTILFFLLEPAYGAEIHEAVQRDDWLDVIRALRKDPKGASAEDEHGNTPLHVAAIYSTRAMVSWLIAEGGDINARNNDGRTPLHDAVLKYTESRRTKITFGKKEDSRREMIGILLMRGADINVKDDRGKRPWHLALDSKNKQLIDLLIPKGVIESLVERLTDNDREIQGEAKRLLKEIGSARTVRPLIALMKGEHERSQYEAMWILENIRDVRAAGSLISALKDENKKVRIAAARTLGELKVDRSVEPLIDLLKDQDVEVRRWGANALGKIKDKRAVEPLLVALKDEHRYVRWEAQRSLGEIGDARAIGPLIDLLKDQDGTVRRQGVRALGKIKDERVVAPVIAALKDENADVRAAAGQVLGQIGSASAVEPLIDAVGDENGRVRYIVVKALGQLKDARAVESLVAIVEDEKGDASIRQNAVTALRSIGGPGIEALNALAKHKSENVRHLAMRMSRFGGVKDPAVVESLLEALKDKDPQVRKNAAAELRHKEDPRIVKPLLAALKDESEGVWLWAAIALGETKDSTLIDPMIAALKDEYIGVRAGAARILGRIRDARSVEPLIAVLDDPELIVRCNAAQSLGYLRDKRATEPLIGLLEDKALRVKWQVVEALGYIRDERAVPRLIALLKEEQDPRRQAQIVEPLARIGGTAIEQLIAVLENSSPEAQKEAIGRLKDRPINLVTVLKSKNKYMQRLATEILCDASVLGLVKSWRDDNLKRRKDAKIEIASLEKQKQKFKEGQDGLRKHYDKMILRAKKDYEDLLLINYGYDETIEALLSLLKSEDAEIRRSAVAVLGKTGDSDVVEPLIAVLRDEKEVVRRWVAQALGELKDGRAVEALTPLLKDEDANVRGEAAKALSRISGEETRKRPAPRQARSLQKKTLMMLYLEGKYDEAKAEAEKILAAKEEPQDSRGWTDICEAHTILGKYSEAAAATKKAMKFTETASGETSGMAVYMYVTLLDLAGKQDEAIEFMTDYSAKFPDSSTGPNMFIPMPKLLECLKEAKKEELHSRLTIFWKFFYEQPDPKEGVRILERHLKIFPEGAEVIKMIKEGRKSMEIIGMLYPMGQY